MTQKKIQIRFSLSHHFQMKFITANIKPFVLFPEMPIHLKSSFSSWISTLMSFYRAWSPHPMLSQASGFFHKATALLHRNWIFFFFYYFNCNYHSTLNLSMHLIWWDIFILLLWETRFVQGIFLHLLLHYSNPFTSLARYLEPCSPKWQQILILQHHHHQISLLHSSLFLCQDH